MLLGPQDIKSFPLIYRHLQKTFGHLVSETLLILDTLPPAHAHEVERLNQVVAITMRDAESTRVVDLGREAHRFPVWAQKHFGSPIQEPRDYRGVPLFGWIAGLEHATTKYVLHCDSDVLVHCAAGYDWLGAAIQLIEGSKDAMFIAPLPGPPSGNGVLYGQLVQPKKDENGNFRFSTFSSRRFLASKSRLEQLLPCAPLYRSPVRRMLMMAGGPSAIVPWESSVGEALQQSGKWHRVHTADPRCWTMHCADHTQQWIEGLPSIISRVERGWFPPQQAGKYDLILTEWV
jgi:hypothetical protein